MTHPQIWPDLLYIVRHGESAGNVAREAALAAGNLTIDLTVRDVDVPLSGLGQEQSVALGKWFA
ncbi:MAG: histidine phosphatase family protein, partial [Gemmatimonadaceae bacterium]